MTPYERAVELARQWVDDPLPVIVCKAMAEAMREASELMVHRPSWVGERNLQERAAEYKQAAKGRK